MGGEEDKKAEPETQPEASEKLKEVADVAQDKMIIPPQPQVEETKPVEDVGKAIVPIEKPETTEEKKPEGSIDRDAVLARVATERRLSLIKAWEESEKCKAENKAQKKIAAIAAWENSKNASLDAELKKIEEQLEKKKAEYVEKIRNKAAIVHKSAEEKRAMVEANRGEDLLKAEEMAAKHRATGTAPKKVLLGCF